MLELQQIKEEILHVFPFGSKVYGTATEQSDEDFIVVVKSDKGIKYQIETDKVHITVYDDATFRELIRRHDIAALECIFSNETEYELELDFERLRRSISAVASNSFVKCKKKLMPGPDYNPYVAKKSLFHSVRILGFGIQIAKYGRIVDFGEFNHYLPIIMGMEDWESLKEYFQPIGNKMKSEFKKLAPLDKDIYNKKW